MNSSEIPLSIGGKNGWQYTPPALLPASTASLILLLDDAPGGLLLPGTGINIKISLVLLPWSGLTTHPLLKSISSANYSTHSIFIVWS